MPNASGTRFLIDLKRCRGPIMLKEGFSIEKLVLAVQEAGMKVMGFSVVLFPDGTVNGHLDLSESHLSFGTYREGRGFSGELNVCNEHAKNRLKGREAARSIRAIFKPERSSVKEVPWKL